MPAVLRTKVLPPWSFYARTCEDETRGVVGHIEKRDSRNADEHPMATVASLDLLVKFAKLLSCNIAASSAFLLWPYDSETRPAKKILKG